MFLRRRFKKRRFLIGSAPLFCSDLPCLPVFLYIFSKLYKKNF